MTETVDESKRNRRTAKRILAIGLPLVLIASVGVGYAFWTSTGTGSGSAATAAGATITVGQIGTLSGLAPGVTAKPISALVTNTGTSTVHIVQVAVSISSVTGAGAGGCTPGDYDLATPNMTTTTPDIAAAGTATFTGATIALKETGVNQDGCKGATVNLKYDAS